MSASITDRFNKAADGNGSYPVLGVVSATRQAGDAVLACQDLTGWATQTAVHFSTYRLDASGAVDITTQTDWKGIVSGNTITNLTRIAGAADTGSQIGDIVELNPTIGWLDDIITGLLKTHTQTGELKSGIVKSDNVDWATIKPRDLSSQLNLSSTYLSSSDAVKKLFDKHGITQIIIRAKAVADIPNNTPIVFGSTAPVAGVSTIVPIYRGPGLYQFAGPVFGYMNGGALFAGEGIKKDDYIKVNAVYISNES